MDFIRPFRINRPCMRIGTILRVPILVSPWWCWMVALISGFAALTYGPMAGLAALVALFAIYFLFVLVHEFGHVQAARHFGYQADVIYIYPMGGLACTYSTGSTPWESFCIAIAGPLTNVGWCLVSLPLMRVSPIFFWVFAINAVLVMFNMLPIYPMDGGRIYKALIQMIFKVGNLKAATITFWTGVIVGVPVAILLIMRGHWWGASIILCAALIWGWQQLKQERAMEEARQFNRGFGARQAGNYAPEVREMVNEAHDICDRADDILRRTRRYARRD